MEFFNYRAGPLAPPRFAFYNTFEEKIG